MIRPARRASAVVVAAGNSRRMGGNVDKTLLPLGAHPVLVHALLAFERCPDVDEVVLVVRADRVKIAAALARATGCAKVRRVVPGGATRLASVRAGVAARSRQSLFAGSAKFTLRT